MEIVPLAAVFAILLLLAIQACQRPRSQAVDSGSSVRGKTIACPIVFGKDGYAKVVAGVGLVLPSRDSHTQESVIGSQA